MKLIRWILKIIRNLLLIMLPFIVIGVIAVIMLFSSTLEVTDSNFWINTSSSLLVYDKDDTLMTKLSLKDTQWVDLYDKDNNLMVSKYYLEGLIATEDQRFESHRGINMKGMMRAVVGHLTGDSGAGGGSSITMQLAKLLYLTPEERSYYNIVDEEGNVTEDKYYISYENPIMYKLTQMILALKIEHKYTKEEILENYINTMYFGHGNYGIYNAAEYYYGVNPKDLTIAQSAMLAGITQAPSNWDPYTEPEDAKERRDIVLSLMLEQKYITQEEYDKASSVDIQEGLMEHSDQSSEYIYNGVLDQVFKELYAEFGTDIDLNSAGMTIHTTIDSDIQQIVYDVQKGADGEYVYYPDEYLQSGVVVMDPQTGSILGVGDNRYTDEGGRQDYALDLSRSPGSSSKPIVDYSAAVEFLNWSSAHQVIDQEMTYSDGTSIKNFEGGYKGVMYLTDALANSRNTTALYAFQQVEAVIGNEAYLDWFNSFGLHEPDEGVLYESASIGGYMTNPLEMTGAYAVLANGGTYYEPHIIDYVEFSEISPYYSEYGDHYDMPYDTWEVMKPSSAYITTMMLNPTDPYAITGSADVSSMDLAIKSGTSNFGTNSIGIDEAAIRDRWLMGYSPDIVTGVWTGYPSSAEKDGYYYYTTTGHVPEQIFRNIMTLADALDKEYLHDDDFVMPDNVETEVIGGRTFYKIKDTDDDQELMQAPEVSISSTATGLEITWNNVDDATNSAVYVDDNLYRTLSDGQTTVTIPFNDLYSLYGCKEKFNVKVINNYDNYSMESDVKVVTIENPTCKK